MKNLILFVILNVALMSDTLSFGVISTVDKNIMKKNLTPLMNYISKTISKDLKFESGFDYIDTIENFRSGKYDLGYIGPSPYVIATSNIKNPIKIIAGLNNKHGGHFHSVIIVKKGSNVKCLADLEGKTFAFGSPQSTLSYFMPMDLLQKNYIDDKISNFVFLGQHDRVAKYIIMGKYHAGAIKESVAKKYKRYIDIIKTTDEVPDFVIVASAKMPNSLVKKIQEALLKPEAQKLASYIKPSATGFKLRKHNDYNELKRIMLKVDPNSLNLP